MKSSYLWAAFVAGIALIGSVIAVAQGPNTQPRPAAGGGGATSGTSVAVIDLQFILDNYKQVKANLDVLKRDADTFQEQIRTTETAYKKSVEELKAMTPGSDAYKQLERSIAEIRTQTQLDITNKQRELGEAETKILSRAHQEIEAAIGRFADRNSIDMVLQINTTQVDPTKPQTVRMALNRQVIFHRNRDISEFILQDLNRGAPAGGVTNSPPPVQPTKGGATANGNASPGRPGLKNR